MPVESLLANSSQKAIIKLYTAFNKDILLANFRGMWMKSLIYYAHETHKQFNVKYPDLIYLNDYFIKAINYADIFYRDIAPKLNEKEKDFFYTSSLILMAYVKLLDNAVDDPTPFNTRMFIKNAILLHQFLFMAQQVLNNLSTFNEYSVLFEKYLNMSINAIFRRKDKRESNDDLLWEMSAVFCSLPTLLCLKCKVPLEDIQKWEQVIQAYFSAKQLLDDSWDIFEDVHNNIDNSVFRKMNLGKNISSPIQALLKAIENNIITSKYKMEEASEIIKTANNWNMHCVEQLKVIASFRKEMCIGELINE